MGIKLQYANFVNNGNPWFRRGGNWNNGSNDGPCYWNCNNTPSNSNINYRARLSYKTFTFSHAVFLATWQKSIATVGVSNNS